MRINEADKVEVDRLSKKYNRTPEEIVNIVESQYLFMRSKTKELDIDRNLSREEFNKLKTNFNIPCIGKLYASYYIYKKINGIKEDNKEE